MPMKQSSTFELNEKSENYAESPPDDDCSPSKQIINHILNYAKVLEIVKTRSGKVFYSIIN